MIKGAIFDFDGTLFDSMFVWETAGERFLRSVGREAEAGLQKILRPMSLQQSAEYVRERYDLPLSVEEIMDGIDRTVEDCYFHQVEPKPGVISFLEELRRREVGTCIATATDRYLVEAALRRCGMERFFSGIFTCTELGHGKDEPVIFQRAMEHLGTSKADTLVFEDACHAVKTAKSGGFLTVAVSDPHEWRQAELRSLADCFLEDYVRTEAFWNFARAL